jgi:hypothetical protein
MPASFSQQSFEQHLLQLWQRATFKLNQQPPVMVAASTVAALASLIMCSRLFCPSWTSGGEQMHHSM